MNPLHTLSRGGQRAWESLERTFDAAFGGLNNPLRQLGTLGFLFFWLLAISGIYLFAVFDTSVSGAFRSIDDMSRSQWYCGGLLRSLHRYAADSFVAVTLAHLAREWLYGRYTGFRRYSWLTGVPLLPMAFASAIGGIWLNWDRLAQLSATATAEWLDAVPIFGAPLTRNFLDADSVSNRLFSLFLFVHVGVALLLVFGLWFHIRHLNKARAFPPRALTVGSIATLLVLSLFAPVTSQGPADLASVPSPLRFDWIVLSIHPLTQATSPGTTWALLAAVLLLLFVLPLWPQRAAAPVARVDPANCNGCGRCVEDCPYEAITMRAHPDQRQGHLLAQVDAARCASCGICAAACPSSTPFRGVPSLATGIDMPQLTIDAVRTHLNHGLGSLGVERKLVLFACEHGAKLDALVAPDLVVLTLICAGMLAPSFVEYALRTGAHGVLVAGCRPGGCAFRLGNHWFEQRLAGTREPHLRASVPRNRLRVAWANRGDEYELGAALNELRSGVATLAVPVRSRRSPASPR